MLGMNCSTEVHVVNWRDIVSSLNDLYDKKLADPALELAAKNSRQRIIIQIHDSFADTQQLAINAMLGTTYVRPHRHNEVEKTEIFRIVLGRADIFLFDNDGNVTQIIEIGDKPDDRKVVAIRSGRWHTVVPRSDKVVLLEAKRQGPKGYPGIDMDKEMAPWAPDETHCDERRKYLEHLSCAAERS